MSYQENTDRLIWTDYYDDFEDWKESTDEEYLSLPEDRLREIFYEANADNLDDERCNLDIQLSAPILVIGDLGLWNGRRTGYKEINSGNVRDCLYSDTDYTTWYVDKNGEVPIVRDSSRRNKSIIAIAHTETVLQTNRLRT